jgi:hypothetical protein
MSAGRVSRSGSWRCDMACIARRPGQRWIWSWNKRGAELLFQVLTKREEKNSVAIASNESFSGAFRRTKTPPASGRVRPGLLRSRLMAAGRARLQFNRLFMKWIRPRNQNPSSSRITSGRGIDSNNRSRSARAALRSRTSRGR